MPTSTTQLHELLTPDTVRLHLEGSTKEAVLNNLIDLLADHPAVIDLEQVRKAVFQREEMMSTGVGKGLALPHAKSPGARDSAAAFAVTDEPVAFNAIDNEPVRLLFLLVGNEEARSQHIKILSRISRLLNQDSFRTRLLQAETVDEVFTLLENGDLQLAKGYR